MQNVDQHMHENLFLTAVDQKPHQKPINKVSRLPMVTTMTNDINNSESTNSTSVNQHIIQSHIDKLMEHDDVMFHPVRIFSNTTDYEDGTVIKYNSLNHIR